MARERGERSERSGSPNGAMDEYRHRPVSRKGRRLDVARENRAYWLRMMAHVKERGSKQCPI
jgi:hypothetical protein